MESRKLRLGILATTFLTYTNLAAAQVTGDEAFGEGGLLGFLVNFYGLDQVNLGSPQTLGYVAGFLLYSAVFYVGMETAIRRTGSDSLMGATGLQSGRSFQFSRRLFAISTLGILTVFSLGASAFQGSVLTTASFFLAGIIGFGIILIIYFVGGGLSAAGYGAMTGAAGAGIAVDGLRRVPEILRGAERDTQEGDTEAAENELEEVLQIIERQVEHLDEVLEKDISDLKTQINSLKNDLDTDTEVAGVDGSPFRWVHMQEKDLKEDLDKISAIIHDLKNAYDASGDTPKIEDPNLQKLMEGGNIAMWGSFGGHSGNLNIEGLNYHEDVIEEVRDHVFQRIGKWEKFEEGEIRDEIDQVIQEAKEISQAHKILKELEKLIDEAENEEQMLEEFAEKASDKGLFKDIDRIEDQTRYIENQLSDLETEEDVIRQEFIELKELLSKILDLDDTERDEIKQNVVEDKRLEEIYQYLIEFLESQFRDGSNEQEIRAKCDSIIMTLEQVRSEAGGLFDANRAELEGERELLREINEVIDSLR
jgi:hypothetical protein